MLVDGVSVFGTKREGREEEEEGERGRRRRGRNRELTYKWFRLWFTSRYAYDRFPVVSDISSLVGARVEEGWIGKRVRSGARR